MKLGFALQFGRQDELEFRAALSKGGMARINAALDEVDATKAEATLESDRNMILSEIDSNMGLGAFNELIQSGMLVEYRTLARQGLR